MVISILWILVSSTPASSSYTCYSLNDSKGSLLQVFLLDALDMALITIVLLRHISLRVLGFPEQLCPHLQVCSCNGTTCLSLSTKTVV